MKPVDLLLRAFAVVGILLCATVAAWRFIDTPAKVAVGRELPSSLRETQIPPGGKDVLLLFVSPNCGVCIESAPFYVALAGLPNRLPILVVGREPVDQIEDFLRQHALRVDSVTSTRGELTGFAGAPSLALVGPNRIVKALWEGRLTDGAAQEALKSAQR